MKYVFWFIYSSLYILFFKMNHLSSEKLMDSVQYMSTLDRYAVMYTQLSSLYIPIYFKFARVGGFS